jgi:hypothetical protein
MIDDTGKIDKFLPLIFRLDKDTVYDVKIDKHREKRSLNANAYLWKLVTEIGNVLSKSKEEVYLQMLKDYGQSMLIPVPRGTIPSRIIKYYEFECSSQLNGKDADWYKCYIGSSEYDTKEMSILLEGVVQEAKNLGIKTKDDIELERMIDKWTSS